MNFSALFIRRPVMTTLVMLAILLTGAQGYRALPVSDLPNVDFPTISVFASLPGASPDTMASSVATPLERQFSTIAGLDSMNSTSSYGSTQVTLQFNLERDIDAAAQDVQSMIMQANRDLPRDMTSPPSYRKVNPADQPVIFIALHSSVLPLSDVNEYADTLLAQRISMIKGVAQVQIYGGQKYAVRVQMDPQALAGRQVGVDEVSSAIQNGNVNLPAGDLQGPNRTFIVETQGQLFRAVDYGPLIVTWRDGSPVRLSDIGNVFDSVENDKVASWYKDTRAIVLAIQRQPGTNTIAVVDAIKKLLPTFREQIPDAVRMDILYDRSESIRASVNDVKFSLVLTAILVVLVIFLFLRNVTATLIPALALILSVIGSFAAMYLCNFSIDNLSLMALTLSVGFVVDDAIVMIENIIRHMERGEDAETASYTGSREIGFTIVSMTISLVAVFIPVLFMGGILGRLFREFAVTISMAILISGFVSLTQTPMLCSRFLRPSKDASHGLLYRVLEKGFDAMLAFYRVTLNLCMRARPLTMLVWLALLIATGFLFVRIPKGFLPSEDTGMIMAMTEAAQGVSFEEMVRQQQSLAKIALEDPNVEGFMSGVGGVSSSNSGRIFMHLKPRNERLGVDALVAQLRAKMTQVPGIKAFLQGRPSISIGGQLTKSLYQFTLQSTNTAELYQYAPKLEARLRDLPGFIDVTTDLQLSNPKVSIDIDRDKAASLGLTVRQIEDSLYTAYGSRQVSTIFAANNQYRIVLEVLPEYQSNPDTLSMMYVRAATGKLVPLDAVAKLTNTVGPMVVTHLGQLPSVTISFNLEPGYSLGGAVDQVRTASAEVLPATITPSFQGTAKAFEASASGMNVLLISAILVIFIVLGILYESYIHPITILSGLPAAGVGALITLELFGMDLNIFSLVGVVMLIGIVKKNSIMMVDFAIERQHAEGVTPAQAVVEAALIRFRPIMMTTMAALMGTLPIALGVGAGSESRRPLGMAVVGGLIVSQMLTLYITPVFYTYMETVRRFFAPKRPSASA